MDNKQKRIVGTVIIIVNLILCYIEGYAVGKVLKDWYRN